MKCLNLLCSYTVYTCIIHLFLLCINVAFKVKVVEAKILICKCFAQDFILNPVFIELTCKIHYLLHTKCFNTWFAFNRIPENIIE